MQSANVHETQGAFRRMDSIWQRRADQLRQLLDRLDLADKDAEILRSYMRECEAMIQQLGPPPPLPVRHASQRNSA
jgi:hypothetical protein